MDAEVLEKLKQQNPRAELFSLRSGADEVVVKSPSLVEWKRFRTFAADERRRADAVETILRACTVFPAPDQLQAMLERRPALCEIFGGQVVDMANGPEDTREVEKKAL